LHARRRASGELLFNTLTAARAGMAEHDRAAYSKGALGRAFGGRWQCRRTWSRLAGSARVWLVVL